MGAANAAAARTALGLGTAAVAATGDFDAAGDAAAAEAAAIAAAALDATTKADAAEAAAIAAAAAGNAATATALQTARSINGVSFNGTADITVPVNGDEFRRKSIFACDYTGSSGLASANSPFSVGNISSGALGVLPTAEVPNHPGILIIAASSGAGANSGGRTGNAGSQMLPGAFFSEAVVNFPVITDLTYRSGFHNSLTASAPTNGAYFEVDAGGDLNGKTAATSSYSTTATDYTLSIDTWYRMRVSTNAALTLITFELFNDSGSLLWSDTLATNIPTASGEGVGVNVNATHASPSASQPLLLVDYMAFGSTAALTR